MDILRQCKYCGLPAHTHEDLTLFVKSKPSKYGRSNICKKCKCDLQRNKYDQKEYIRKYRIKNRDTLKCKIQQWDKNWREANRDKRSHNEAKRRESKYRSLSVMTEKDKKSIQILYKVARIMSKLGSRKYHIDHIIPLSKGGTHTLDNLQLIDSVFNISKGNKISIGLVYQNKIRKDIFMPCKTKPGKKPGKK